MDKKLEDLVARERMLENRTVWLNAHDAEAARRDLAIAEREELVQLREAQVEARAEVNAARAERDELLLQLRDANERLVLASLDAQELAEDAIAARTVASDMAERFRSLIQTSSSLTWFANASGLASFSIWRISIPPGFMTFWEIPPAR